MEPLGELARLQALQFHQQAKTPGFLDRIEPLAKFVLLELQPGHGGRGRPTREDDAIEGGQFGKPGRPQAAFAGDDNEPIRILGRGNDDRLELTVGLEAVGKLPQRFRIDAIGLNIVLPR